MDDSGVLDIRAKMRQSLEMIFHASFILGSLGVIVMLLVPVPDAAVAMSVALAVFVIGYAFLRAGNVEVSAVILMMTALVVITYLAILSFGIRDHAILLFPAVIVAASLLFDTKWLIGITGLVIAAITGIVVGELYGLYETPLVYETDIYDLALVVLAMVLIAVIARILSEHLRAALRAAEDSRLRYYEVFNGAPVSIWVVNLAPVLDAFERLNESSSEGLPEILSRLEVIDVNDMTVEMFEADSKEQMLLEHSKVLVPDSMGDLRTTLKAMAKGDSHIDIEAQMVTLKGRPLNTIVSIAPGSKQTLVTITDISAQKKLEHEVGTHEQKIKRAYSDVIEAVTQEKLVVSSRHDLEDMLGEPMGSTMSVTEPSQLEGSRRFVRDEIGRYCPEMTRVGRAITAIGEAVTNGVKHAGTCRIQMHMKSNGGSSAMQLAVRDSGNGIDFLHLPKALLVAGFSTESSLGMGFTIMLDICDQLSLATDDKGTVVVLEFNLA